MAVYTYEFIGIGTLYSEDSSLEVGSQMYVNEALTAPVYNGYYEYDDGTKNFIRVEGGNGAISQLLYSFQAYLYGVIYTNGLMRYGSIVYEEKELTNEIADGSYEQTGGGVDQIKMLYDNKVTSYQYKFSLYNLTLDSVVNSHIVGGYNNEYVAYNYLIRDYGTTLSPYSVTTGAGVDWNSISSGGSITFDDIRISNVSTRVAEFTDGQDGLCQFEIPTVQYIANESYYTYTFEDTGDIVITPNIPTADYNVVPEYRIVDIQSGAAITGWQTTTSFENIPLKDVYLEIRDEVGTTFEMTLAFESDEDLTEVTNTADISLVNDPMVAAWDSNLKDSEAFTYYYTMYDDNDELIATRKIIPDVNNQNYGIYNMNMLYKNYVKASPNLFIDDIIVTDEVYSYTYGVSGLYGVPGYTSDTKYIIKGSTEYGEDFDIEEYTSINSVNTNDFIKLLSDWNEYRSLRVDDYAVVNYLNGRFNGNSYKRPFTHIAFMKFEGTHRFSPPSGSNGNYIAQLNSDRTQFIPIGIDITDNLNKLLTLPIGIQNFQKALDLDNVVDHDLNPVTENFLLDDDVHGWSVALVSYDVVIPGFFYFTSWPIYIEKNQDETCLKYEPTRFTYLDTKGCYNSFTFNGANIKEYSIQRNQINNDYYNLINDEWTYNDGDRGRKNVNINKLENHSATSGWLDTEKSDNLMSMYSSSDVYVIRDEKLFPVIITSNKVEAKNNRNNRLFNHTITYQMAYDINTND